MRDDPHRPGAIVPADYDFVLWYALAHTVEGWPQPSMNINCELDRRRELGDRVVEGEHRSDSRCCVVALRRSGARWAQSGSTGQCTVCGAHFIYGEVWRHRPSDELIHLGHTCAEKYEMLTNLRDLEQWRQEQRDLRAASLLKQQRASWRDAFLASHAGLADDLAMGEFTPVHPELEGHGTLPDVADQECPHCRALGVRGLREDQYRRHTLRDLDSKLRRYGTLSAPQVGLAKKLADELRNPGEKELVVPAPAGVRAQVEGEVVSAKEHSSLYGETWKMTVRVSEERGSWLFWCTVPQSLHDEYMADEKKEVWHLGRWLRGRRVRLTATFERGSEEHFAFGKRPTGAVLLAGGLV